ncbi:MAG: pyridoxamine 5'-phosphate oxidase family protein [Chloroflexi bacterium]|nr:pyridoxamine 5'-phosphate oxidase family protein [Chloroflexota bacterium]
MTFETIKKARALLSAQSTMTLATVNARGRTESAPLFFAEDDGTLIWVSGQRSRHSRNIAAAGRASVSAHNTVWSWNEIAGVQMEGEVSLIPLGPGARAGVGSVQSQIPFRPRIRRRSDAQ